MVAWLWPELADTKDQIRTSAFKLSGAEVFEEPKVLLLYFVYFFVIKVQEEGMGSLESEQHNQRRSSMACGSMAKLQAACGGALG